MKILHTLASPVWSGPAEPVALIAAAQAALGHHVSVAIDRKRLEVSSEELALPRLQELGLLDAAGLELSVKSSPFAAWADMRRLRRISCDIVHSHFTHDHVVARWGLPRGAKLVRSIHAPRSLRVTMPRCDALTVPYEALLAQAPNVPSMVLPALVGPVFAPAADRVAARAALGLPSGPLVGMVSTLQESRRHDVAVDALAQLRAREPSAHLVVLGDGAHAATLRAHVLSVGLKDAVTFAGYQHGDDFAKWVQAFDEVWVLGLGNDWAARAAAQARRCGARIVAVDEGALSTYADAVVAPTPEAVAAAALKPDRRALTVPDPTEVARSLLELYAKVRA
ncbi:MAG: glycosyltransferase [Myxococcaceae bacterium]|nr:glycosyltransferase [Myxococcaceae bacterium]